MAKRYIKKEDRIHLIQRKNIILKIFFVFFFIFLMLKIIDDENSFFYSIFGIFVLLMDINFNRNILRQLIQ